MKNLHIIAIVTLLLAACAPQHEGPAIGGLFCQTGFASFAGESSRDGFLLAIADAESRDVEIDYVIEDCESDFTTTRTAAQKLIEVDGIDIIVGPEWEMGAVVAPFAAEGRALIMSPWLTIDPEWTEPELFMSAMTREQHYTDDFAVWMAENGFARVALVRSIDDFAYTVEKTVKVAFPREGIELAGVIEADNSQNDFRMEIERLKRIEADAVFVAFATDDAEATFIRQATELGLEMQIFAHYARAESGAFLAACGNACEGVIFASPRQPEHNAEFREKFRAHYGRDPIAPSAATAYDATTAIIAAIESGAETPLEVSEFLKTYETDGFSGPFAFDDGFIAKGDAVVKRFEDGERVVIA